MSKRTKLRKRSESRSLKPILFWLTAMVIAIALTIVCIMAYIRTGPSTATEGTRVNPMMSTGPFYLIVILVTGSIFTLVMTTMEIRRYVRMGKARRR
jgi:hypothetical protein